MEYIEAIAFLRELTKFGFNFGLARVEKLLELLGNPEQKYKCVHVGGTNGKGSVCAYTANVLAAAGYKTGLFTSPHLHSYTERIKINGENISKAEVANYIAEFKPLLLQMVQDGYEHPTEFEVNTALAFKYFADQKVDLAVVEVGMGGAIDSTNVLSPVVTAITNVTYDHMDYLGATIEEIAGVKAGIIKQGIPCVTAAEGEALEVIKERCHSATAMLTLYGEDIVLKDVQLQEDGMVMSFDCGGRKIPPLKTLLLGEHQQANAGVALGIVVHLREKGFKITDGALQKGLSETRWPARLEVISRQPFILLDAAHNHAGAQVLAKALNKLLAQKAVFVLGMLADKERQKILSEILPFAVSVIVTKPNSPRAGSWQEVKSFVEAHGVSAEIEENISLAVQKALQSGLSVVITGSIYMVAEARAYLLGIEQE